MVTKAQYPARKGRPAGSVSLSKDRADTIVNFIRAGAFDQVAAEAAGVSARTFRDWMARGEGRGSRPATPKLIEFAARVRTAKAEARLAAEVRVYRDNPTYWLTRAARSTELSEGWTEPPKGGAGNPRADISLSKMTDEELEQAITDLTEGEIDRGTFTVPPCSRPRCGCEFHPRNRRDP